MTFENWWRSKYPTDIGEIEFRLLREAWNAAANAEREKCAEICDTHTVDDVLIGVGIAKSCAAMIRMRSNVEVRGSR